MNIEKMREEFEAEMVADGKSIRRCQDSYHFSTIHRKWLFWKKAWQASRAAVAVELPSDQCIDIHGYSPKATKLYCRKAIEAAGLKVAP